MNGNAIYNCRAAVSWKTLLKLSLAAFIIGFMWNAGLILAEYIFEGWIF